MDSRGYSVPLRYILNLYLFIVFRSESLNIHSIYAQIELLTVIRSIYIHTFSQITFILETEITNGDTMFKTPEIPQLIILGREITLEINDEMCLQHNADGLTIGTRIVLRSQYPDFERYTTVVMHESIHALCDVLGVQLPLSTEEIFATTISETMVEIISVLLGEESEETPEDEPVQLEMKLE